MSFRSRRSYSTARPSSLYSVPPTKSSTSFLGKGLSQSTPFLNAFSASPYSSAYSNNYTSPVLSSLSPYSSYTTPSLQRSVSPTYSTAASKPHTRSHRSFSVNPTFSRYPTFHKSSKTRSRSSSEGYSSGGEKEKTDEPVSRVSQSDQQVDDSESASENGEIDYKKLYEESQGENQRLREKLKKAEDDLTRAKLMSDKVPYVPMRNSMSEAEKREKKAMERKLSEMEEELKQLQKLKAENERLKAENRALTRVVSKLTASHNAT